MLLIYIASCLEMWPFLFYMHIYQITYEAGHLQLLLHESKCYKFLLGLLYNDTVLQITGILFLQVLSGSIENVPIKEKAKFPQEFFPDVSSRS